MFNQRRNTCNFSIIWKYSVVEILSIAMANGWLKTFAHSFISFVGILSIPVDFLSSVFFKVVLHHEQKLLEGGCFQQWDFFSMSFSFIALILSWLANDLEITSSALLLSSISFHKSVLRYSCSGHWKFL